jgi:DNA-binding HxlR family transcriptional regulator
VSPLVLYRKHQSAFIQVAANYIIWSDPLTQSYGQWCPIAKSSEVLCERWTILIIRELLMGSTRFSELERGLGSISPTLLTRRLATLQEFDLVYKRRISGGRSHEYLPTAQCRELRPILLALGSWGMVWSKSRMQDADYDAALLMLYLQRSVIVEALPGMKAVIMFRFIDFSEESQWWITANEDAVDVCTTDPGLDVDVFITTTVRVMTDAWMGRTSYRLARKSDDFDIVGPSVMTRDIGSWLSACVFADLSSPEEILELGGRTMRDRKL